VAQYLYHSGKKVDQIISEVHLANTVAMVFPTKLRLMEVEEELRFFV